MKTNFQLLFLILVVLPCLIFSQEESAKTVTVGFVIDGPGQNLNSLDTLVISEIKDLLHGEFKLFLPEDKQITCKWEADSINNAIDALLQDDEVDVIITLGTLSSHEASKRKNFSKPVIAPMILDPSLQGTPVNAGTSGIENFNYVSQFIDTRGVIKLFSEIFPSRNVTVIFQKSAVGTVKSLEETVAELESQANIKVTMVQAETSAAKVLEQIPADTQLVYLSKLYRFSEAEMIALATGLVEKKIPSVTLESRDTVEKGFCATFTPDNNNQRLARRVALNLQRILLGEAAADLPVAFSSGHLLLINMKTLREIGKYPSWNILFEAELINDEPLTVSRRYSLKEAMQESVEVNLDILVSIQKKIAGNENINKARANFRPQVQASLTALQIDSDRAEASFGQQPESTLSGKLTLTQLLFSERADANLEIQKILQNTNELDLEKIKLDIALQAGKAYINVLLAENMEQIRKNNLKVTRTNLELAKVRKAVGISGSSDVYRWQAQLATAQNDVNHAQKNSNLAKMQFNRILHRPLEEEFALAPVSEASAGLLIRENDIFKYTGNPITFKHFKNFLVNWGIENSTEIASLDAAIAAKNRLLASERASYFSPAVALQATLEQRLAKGGAGTEGLDLGSDFPIEIDFPLPDDTNWNVAIQASLPLFQGGARNANVRQFSEEISGLKLQRSSAMEKIGQNIRSSAQIAGTSYISIGLSKKAQVAAEKNLELVQDAYSRGVINIIDLLDAQNAALTAELLSAASTHTFAAELLQTERATGKFVAFMNETQWQGFKNSLNNYFSKMGVKPENWQY